MKSAIEEHGLASTVCHWWRLSSASKENALYVINWLHGAGAVFPDEAAAEEMYFLFQVLYEKRMMS